jgi:hypothetical protein
MKSIISKTFALLIVAAALLSFTANFGGEGFEISLNGKVVLQQFGKEMDAVKTLQLSSSSPNDLLTIRYHHCGKVGKNRIVAIKDGQGKLLKEWKFKDVPTPYGEMSCKVQDLLSLKNGSDQVLKLYYSSSELPNGRQLATVSLQSKQDHAAVIK